MKNFFAKNTESDTIKRIAFINIETIILCFMIYSITQGKPYVYTKYMEVMDKTVI